MHLGASIPVSDIGTGPAVLRDYAQAAEELGFAHLVAPDHVLGVNPDADHGGRRVGTTANAYHASPTSPRTQPTPATITSGSPTAADHLAAITRHRAAVADLL